MNGFQSVVCMLVYNGKLLSTKQEWNLALCNNIDGPRVYYTKCSKSEKERQILYDFPDMCNLIKVKQTEKNKQNITETIPRKEQLGGCHRGGGRAIEVINKRMNEWIKCFGSSRRETLLKPNEAHWCLFPGRSVDQVQWPFTVSCLRFVFIIKNTLDSNINFCSVCWPHWWH